MAVRQGHHKNSIRVHVQDYTLRAVHTVSPLNLLSQERRHKQRGSATIVQSEKYSKNSKSIYRHHIYTNSKQLFKFINLLSFTVISITISSIFSCTNAALLQGCSFDETLCERNEECIPDGLFGQCYSDTEMKLLKPLVINQELDPFQQELFRLEMKRLFINGLNWPHARAQCTLAYFKLTVIYDLDYDPQFCAVRNPNNIWALVQEVQNFLTSEKTANKQKALLRKTLLLNNIDLNKINDNLQLLKPYKYQRVDPTFDENEDSAAEEPLQIEENEAFPVVLVNENNLMDALPLGEMNADDDELQNKNKNVFDAALQSRLETAKRSTNDQIFVDNYDGPFSLESLSALGLKDGQQQWDDWMQRTLPPVYSNKLPKLSKTEKEQLDDYVTDVLENRHPKLNALSNNQLENLIVFINSLKTVLQEKAAELEKDEEAASAPELEEVIPLTSENNEQQLLLKKDAEKFNNADMGLANTVHKIVKGGVQRIEGNRVYLKVTGTKTLTEEGLYKLINYLDQKIAEPKNLLFDKFAYENGQLSFRVARLKFVSDLQKLFDTLNLDNLKENGEAPGQQVEKNNDNAKKGTQLESTNSVAQAVYKRRKDIQSLSGVKVDETGIGSGVDVVPVESSRHDWLFVPVVALCGLSVATLCVVLAVQFARARGLNNIFSKNKNCKNSNLPQVIDHLEGKPSSIYEDLCRQRMSSQDIPVPANVVGPLCCATVSKHSSTSSWPDDSVLQTSNLDISTGHLILTFLNDCLQKPEEISNQWNQLAGYENTKASKNFAAQSENVNKNYDSAILPYDDFLITIAELQQKQRQSSNDDNGTVLVNLEDSNEAATITQSTKQKYINASKIFDADPRQIAYIAAQTPLQQTCADFWQMIWQEGIVLIVNLCDQANDQQSKNFVKYWPEEGFNVFGIFQIHLVSEHIWSEDYVVRSLYLKNLNTNETRTVTQFHYLTWKEGGLPNSTNSFLEFRRKVNKSYRGHASPILVHCTNGAGRTGTYCLIDMVMTRIFKGVKELNIAGSLEHLRDQRMQMVSNEEQYKLVIRCVAEEVTLLLKNFQN